MTMKIENPKNWSADMKALGQLIILVISIVGSVGGFGIYVGSGIYKLAEIQTLTMFQLRTLQTQMVEAQGALVESNKQREVSINGLKLELSPRIDTLETAIHIAETEASAAKQRADDMKEDLRRILALTEKNLNVNESHTDDIKATREAVAPKGTP